MKMKIAGIQIDIKDALSEEDKKANVGRAADLIKGIGSADLIVLPELFTIGYGRNAFKKLSDLAEDENGETVRMFCELAREKNSFIVFGFPEKKDGRYMNSVAVISNKGELAGIYRKIHIAQFGNAVEKEFFERGNRTLVFDVGGIKAGIINCYDIRFPELARKLSLEGGIDLLVHPVAFSKDNSFPSWHHFVITRALENQVYALSLNRAGKDYGNSIFCPPWIDWEVKPTILGEGEEILEKEIDTEEIKKVREEYQFRKDVLGRY